MVGMTVKVMRSRGPVRRGVHPFAGREAEPGAGINVWIYGTAEAAKDVAQR
jgi:hypothetical protein